MEVFSKSSSLQGTAESPQVENKSAADDCITTQTNVNPQVKKKKKKN